MGKHRGKGLSPTRGWSGMGEGSHSRRKGSHSCPPTCLSTQPAPGAQQGVQTRANLLAKTELTCRHEPGS